MADAVVRAGGSGGGGGTPTVPGPNWISRLVTFYHGVVAEMKKVTWPDRQQVQQATISIILFVLALGAVISILDLILQGLLIKGIPSLFAGR
jgi:preprotein translocase subunit SecE